MAFCPGLSQVMDILQEGIGKIHNTHSLLSPLNLLNQLAAREKGAHQPVHAAKLSLPEHGWGGNESQEGIQNIFNAVTFACVPKRA